MRTIWRIGWLALAIVLSACETPAPTPIATDVPTAIASSTPVKIPMPLFTPTPAVMVPPLTTPRAFAAAIAKTQAAQAYRVAMTFSVKQGNAPQFSLDLKGEVNNSDAHYMYQLGDEQIEFVAAHGQFFAKGARSINLPTLTKWYTLTPDLADAAQPPFSPQDVLSGFAAQTAKVAFQPPARESLDGQNCQAWRAVPQTLTETGISDVLGASQETVFNTLDQAEIKLWLCDDGALHQLSVDVAAHDPKKSSDKGIAKLLLHIWDIGSASIKIDAPANAEPFRLAVPTR
jgi:hypothetical protein